jgi:hypothetical protein
VIGLLALATGLAYTALGVITTYELIRYRRERASRTSASPSP